MILILAIFLTAWLTGSVLAYVLVRKHDRECTGEWRRKDRALAIFLALIGGPALATIVYFMVYGDEPASW